MTNLASQTLRSSPAFLKAKQDLLTAIAEASRAIHEIKPPNPVLAETTKTRLQEFTHNRGLDAFYPYLSSGLGSGPFVELADGSVKLDLISGIGIHFFGHSHPALTAELIDATAADAMHGNLQPAYEATLLTEELLATVKDKSRLRHAWSMCSGTMVNEFALKVIRQKHAPATKILAFNDCFAGRSTAMQEITDGPALREGQPTYQEVNYLPFYDAKLGLEASLQNTLSALKLHLEKSPGQYCALMMELIQGEGGFKVAPREFYLGLFEQVKAAGLAIWFDEIQTFGRTGELFAFQKLGLDQWADVVTIGKLLQSCMVLYTPEYKPKAGLIGGTFSGSAAAIRTGRKILQMLTTEGYLGPQGKIEKLSQYFVSKLQALSETSCRGKIGEIRAIGGMIAFEPFGGTLPEVKALLHELYTQGVVAYYCGHGPHLVRLLPPLGVMTEKEIDLACNVIEKTIASRC